MKECYAPQVMLAMVPYRPILYKMVLKGFRAVQKGMLSKWCLNGFGPSTTVCYKNGVEIFAASTDGYAMNMVYKWCLNGLWSFEQYLYTMFMADPSGVAAIV